MNVLSAGSAGVEFTQSSPQPRERSTRRNRTGRVGSGGICREEVLGWRYESCSNDYTHVDDVIQFIPIASDRPQSCT